MKKLILQVLAAGAAVSALVAQGAVINFSSTGPLSGPGAGAALTFYGSGSTAYGSFGFTASSDTADYGSYQWVDTDNGAYLGSFIGANANNRATAGTFAFDNAHPNADGSWVATITTPPQAGNFTILDYNGNPLVGTMLSGTLSWNTIYTYGFSGQLPAPPAYGGTIGINIAAGSTYTGTDPVLTELMRYGGTLDITFSFTQANLGVLAQSGGQALTWGGQIAVVPETSTAVAGFAAFGIIVLLIGRRSWAVQNIK